MKLLQDYFPCIWKCPWLWFTIKYIYCSPRDEIAHSFFIWLWNQVLFSSIFHLFMSFFSFHWYVWYNHCPRLPVDSWDTVMSETVEVTFQPTWVHGVGSDLQSAAIQSPTLHKQECFLLWYTRYVVSFCAYFHSFSVDHSYHAKMLYYGSVFFSEIHLIFLFWAPMGSNSGL